MQQDVYNNAWQLAQQAFQLALHNEPYHAQELLLSVRNELKRVSGDLPIIGFVGYTRTLEESTDQPFVTQSIAEARAWGWLELASGVYKLVEQRPGSSLVHFTRAWRIWRPWSMHAQGIEQAQMDEARHERVRAGLWLGEAWARFMSDRAEHAARAVLRASLAELERIGARDVLHETIEQQRLLPPASIGVPAYRPDATTVPYVCLFVS